MSVGRPGRGRQTWSKNHQNPKQKVTHTRFCMILKSYGDRNQRKEPTGNLTIENAHIPISVSVGDTLEREPTHICEKNPKVLVHKFMKELKRREKNIRATSERRIHASRRKPATQRSEEKDRRMVRSGPNTWFQLRGLRSEPDKEVLRRTPRRHNQQSESGKEWK